MVFKAGFCVVVKAWCRGNCVLNSLFPGENPEDEVYGIIFKATACFDYYVSLPWSELL